MVAPSTAAGSTTATAQSGAIGAGLSLTKSGANNPNPLQHGKMGQAERAFSAASTFLSGAMAISASQFIGAPLKLVDPTFYDAYMAWTKESFAVLLNTVTQFWAPTIVRVSGDESMKGQLYQMDDGSLKCNFPHRLVLMANHQLYTDWMYLWWVAYTNKMHGRIYIILKESLKHLPIFGWGCQFYNFIFLSRKWETDRWRFKHAFNHLQNPTEAMWLLIFPEGTNLSAQTREKSAAWSKKTGMQDMKHQLLPRSTGLQFCLQELHRTTNWLYDCTVAYEGVPKGMYGQDVFTLRSSFFEGRPPKSVNMFWRRYKISDIPIDNDEAFARWLNNRWREKDYILEFFYKFGSFPEGDVVKAMAAVEGKQKPQHTKMITTEVKGGGWDEFLGIFGPITSVTGALANVDLTEPLSFDSLLALATQQQKLSLLGFGKAPTPATSQEAIRKALTAANKNKPLPKGVFDKLVAEPPRTQAEMKRALVQSGNPEVAKKAAKAPSVNGAIGKTTQQNIAKTARQVLPSQIVPTSQAKSVRSVQSGGGSSVEPHPKYAMKKDLPLANMESMITRPLSTLAVQKAVNAVRNSAAQRTKKKGAALPGQTPVPVKAASPAAKPPSPALSVAPNARKTHQAHVTARAPEAKTPADSNGALTQIALAKLNQVNGAKKVVAPNKPAVIVKKSAPKPIGTQKLVNGQRV